MKKAFFLCLLVAIAVIGITSCEKAPKGILEGSVYMTKDGSSGFVASDGTTTVKLDMKLTFKSDKDCGINFVYQNGKTFSRYEGTYTVSEPEDNGIREVVISTNITKFNITEIAGNMSSDLKTISAMYGSQRGVFYKQE